MATSTATAPELRREARVLHLNESGSVAFAGKWHDYGCVSIRDAAVACFQANYGIGFGVNFSVKRTIEVRDKGVESRPPWQLTVEPQVNYEVKGLRGEADEPDPAAVSEALYAIAERQAPVENQCQASDGVPWESEPNGRRFEVHSCGRSHTVVADEVLNVESSGLLEFIFNGRVVASFREWSSYVCVPYF